jgi:hypothetical protein
MSAIEAIAWRYQSDDKLKFVDEAYSLIGAGLWDWAPWLQRTMLFPTREFVGAIVDHIVSTESTGLCSIGCGTGLIEWFIASHKSVAVRGIDRKDVHLQLLPEAARAIGYSRIVSDLQSMTVFSQEAMLVSWPELDERVWLDYVRRYQGRCILLIVDRNDTRCSPSFAQLTAELLGGGGAHDSDQVELDNGDDGEWMLAESSVFENRCGNYPHDNRCLFAVFTRRQKSCCCRLRAKNDVGAAPSSSSALDKEEEEDDDDNDDDDDA